MAADLALPLVLTFVAVALATWSATSLLLARTSPERRRLVPVRSEAVQPRTRDETASGISGAEAAGESARETGQGTVRKNVSTATAA